MSADELSRLVLELAAIGQEALTQASVTGERTEDAVSALRHASDRLQVARDHAMVHVNDLDEMIAKAKLLLEGSQNIEALQVLSNLELARQKMHNFWIMVKYQVEKIDSVAAVVEMGKASEDFRESRQAFNQAVASLTEYSKGL